MQKKEQKSKSLKQTYPADEMLLSDPLTDPGPRRFIPLSLKRDKGLMAPSCLYMTKGQGYELLPGQSLYRRPMEPKKGAQNVFIQLNRDKDKSWWISLLMYYLL